jgi:hypothetical protein
MCAKCIVLDHESRENFLILIQQHSDLFQPANEVEVGMIEEMCAAYWRQRRAWTIETALLEKQIALQPGDTAPERMAAAFDHLAAAPKRSIRTLILLRTVKLPNDPSPISEHPPDALTTGAPPVGQATDSEALSGAANPGCSRLSAGYRSSQATASTATPPRAKESGGAD